jgi:hypothetical protein
VDLLLILKVDKLNLKVVDLDLLLVLKFLVDLKLLVLKLVDLKEEKVVVKNLKNNVKPNMPVSILIFQKKLR